MVNLEVNLLKLRENQFILISFISFHSNRNRSNSSNALCHVMFSQNRFMVCRKCNLVLSNGFSQKLLLKVKANGLVDRKLVWNMKLFGIFLVLYHCVKSVQIRSFFWFVFSCIRTEYGDLLRKALYSVRMLENTDQKKLRT